jgi:NAD(P)-dependent dehydrogenase (short-subunit alcohol dehydrogenase family)
MSDLKGKVAAVTGGSKGIGRAIAFAFAEAGADVALAARGPEALETAQKEIEERGVRAIAVPTDVSDPDQCQALVDRTVAELGTLDILVNNAGAAPFLSTFDQIRMDGFLKYFRILFDGTVYCTKAAAPVLLEKGEGSVINVASVAAYIASPGLTYYSSAKAAVVNLTRTLALEWAASGIRVNAIAPGWIETEMNVKARENEAYYEGILSQIPIGRWGTAEEVANVALFLASEASSYMTGSVIIVDGGQTLSTLTGM